MSNLINRSLQGGAVAAALLLCSAAPAQDRNESRNESRQQGSSMKQSSQRAEGATPSAERGSKEEPTARTQANQEDRAPTIVIGEVVEKRNVDVKGKTAGQHQLVKVRLSNGDNVVVDAGSPSKGAKLANVSKGDRILAVGRPGRINDRPVLVARSIGELYSTGVTGSEKGDARKQQRSAG